MKKKGSKRRGSIKSLLVTIIIGVTLVTSIGLEAFSIINTIATTNEQTAAYRNRLTEDIQDELRHEVEVVVSMIDQFHQRQESGEMTEKEAKKMAADIVRELRYDDGAGYFWIDTTEGVNVVLLGRDTEGNSRYDAVDPNGVKYIQEILNAGMQTGGGYAYFSFAKPDETEPLPKMSYSLEYEPYDWVIGTGVWIDHIDALEAEYKGLADAAMRSELHAMPKVFNLMSKTPC